MIDQENDLTKKWEFLMEGLPESKIQRSKFARIYEKIVKNNRKEDLSTLLAITYRIFKNKSDFKMSNGKKQSKTIAEFFPDDFIINNDFIANHFILFCDAVASKAIESLATIKLGYLEIRTDKNQKKINIVY